MIERTRCANTGSLSDLLGFDATGYLAANRDVGGAIPGLRRACAFAHWLVHGEREGRVGSGLSPYRKRKPPAPLPVGRKLNIAFYGPISARSGLGAAARGYAEALARIDCELEIIDSSSGYDPRRFHESLPRPRAKPDVLLLHHNPDSLPNVLERLGATILDDTYVVGLWVWELMRPDDRWVEHFAAVDEVWAPSAFVRDAFATLAPAGMTVEIVPYVVAPPPPRANDWRGKLAIPADAFVFLCVFDASSSFERKNPQAAVEAFTRAFGGDPAVFMLMKCHSSEHNRAAMNALRASCEGANIRYVDASLDEADNDALKQACDCLVSPHRSEGFGLNVAEMMGLGKPVIATDYSGSASFLDANTGFPISFRLVESTASASPYPPARVWADPNIDDLSRQMRRVRAGGAQIEAIARAGRERILRDHSVAAIGAIMARRIEAIREGDFAAAATLSLPQRKGYVWRHPVSLSRGREGVVRVSGDGPLISVLMPVLATSRDDLLSAVRSVRDQSWPYWELCLTADASIDALVNAALDELRGDDHRIMIRRLDRNAQISEASNFAIEMASGGFVTFLDARGALHRDALARYVQAIAADPMADMIIGDLDDLGEADSGAIHAKSVQSGDFAMHAFCLRKASFLGAGGFRHDCAAAPDHDLARRLSAAGAKILRLSPESQAGRAS